MKTNMFFYLLVLAQLALLSSALILSAGICYTGCNALWVACVSAAGGVAGVSTGGAGVPTSILTCNSAQGTCMGYCVAAVTAPL